MTRFFFPTSRAHHAYSMAIDFGMKFEKADGLWTPEGLLNVTGAGGYRIVVAQLSMSLLEPQVGDIVGFREGRVVRVSKVTDANRHRPIIQRNGIAFHWPECEA